MPQTNTGRLTRMKDSVMAGDDVIDLAHVVALFGVYAGLDLATRLLANIDDQQLRRSVLLVSAIASNPLAVIAFVAGLVLVAAGRLDRFTIRWQELDHGHALRWLATPLILLLAWQGGLYKYNFVLDRSHGVDRMLIIALAIGCLARPAFLVPFALQTRVIAAQFDYPFGTTAAQNIDELLVIALLAIASAHIWFVISGHTDTAPVLLLLGAAIATHFYIPGRTKMGIDWLATNDISNLPLSAYTVGWRGQGDGSWSRQMAEFARMLGRAGLVATLALELGALLAVTNYRLLRFWILMCIPFHVVLFAFTGFWFLSWIVLQLGLALLLWRPANRQWAHRNLTPARGAFAFGVVLLGGSTLFHPPSLAWLDAPVSYGYRIEATGESGTKYQVPISAFAPLEQELAFYRFQLGDAQPLSGAYGAIVSATEYDRLKSLTSFGEVEGLEQATMTDQRLRGEDFIRRFVDNANSKGPGWWSSIAAPDHFWTGAKDPTYSFQEPVTSVEVSVLTALHNDGDPQFKRDIVLSIQVDDTGKAQVCFP